jgi:ketosteroid isomerase-like protein
VGNEFGDTLVACVECGVVLVAEKVTTDENLVETAAKTGRPFVGRVCFVCRLSEGAVSASWRLLKGPLRVPRK